MDKIELSQSELASVTGGDLGSVQVSGGVAGLAIAASVTIAIFAAPAVAVAGAGYVVTLTVVSMGSIICGLW